MVVDKTGVDEIVVDETGVDKNRMLVTAQLPACTVFRLRKYTTVIGTGSIVLRANMQVYIATCILATSDAC